MLMEVSHTRVLLWTITKTEPLDAGERAKPRYEQEIQGSMWGPEGENSSQLVRWNRMWAE